MGKLGEAGEEGKRARRGGKGFGGKSKPPFLLEAGRRRKGEE